MPKQTEEFLLNQKVYKQDRHPEKQPNGYIEDIFWDEEQIMVKFHDGDVETYDFHDFEGKWTDKFGGTWMI